MADFREVVLLPSDGQIRWRGDINCLLLNCNNYDFILYSLIGHKVYIYQGNGGGVFVEAWDTMGENIMYLTEFELNNYKNGGKLPLLYENCVPIM